MVLILLVVVLGREIINEREKKVVENIFVQKKVWL